MQVYDYIIWLCASLIIICKLFRNIGVALWSVELFGVCRDCNSTAGSVPVSLLGGPYSPMACQYKYTLLSWARIGLEAGARGS